MPIFQSKRVAKRNEIIRLARNVIVEVHENYKHERGNFQSTPRHTCKEPALNITERAFRKSNLVRVRNSEPYDFKIVITVHGFCFPKRYKWTSGREDVVYSGARINGNFRFFTEENLPGFKRSFWGEKDNPETLRNPGYRTRPVHAPFDEAFNKSNFKTKMERALDKFFAKK